MRSKAGRVIVACCALVVVAGLVAYSVLGGRAAAQTLSDVGKFKVGSVLGEERAGFSGRPKVQVFTNPADPAWPAIASCLQSDAVSAEMVGFVGVLIDDSAEPEVEAVFHRNGGFAVIVRSLQGTFPGGLKSGFTCDDLVSLLRVLRSSTGSQKSSIYMSLLETADALDPYVQNGESAKANRFCDLLDEFEGSNSQSVIAAKNKLGRN